MKPLIQILLLALLLATGYTAKAQVMISQYIEGTGTTPKGIEVYNHTAYPIDFSVTPLEVYEGKDGAACTNLPGATVNSGVLMPFQVWVLGTSELTTFALNGSDISGTTTNGFDFTGNDALELYLGGVLIDAIGTCGSDPVTSWSGNGVSTAGQNIATKPGVCAGIINSWTDPSIRFETIGIGADMTGFGESPSCPTQECMHESFVNIPLASSNSYSVRTWTGDNGYDFTATDSRADQSINGKAITILNGLLTVTGVTGGIGALSLTTQRVFAGGSGTIDVTINGNSIGTIPYDSTIQTTTINGINISGLIDLEIVVGSSVDRIKIDDLKWTCYDSPVITSITSVSSLAYSVDCYATDNGTVNFTSAGVFAPGNTFTAELSDETGSFINYTEIGTLSLSGTDPSGTVPFTIPPNTTAGTNYRIRVVSDTPYSNVTDNGNDITINNTQPCIPIVPLEGALLINEFSNGPAGNEEYYELLVVGKCGDTVDLRGYILDDNNGEFGSEGLSPGHLKLSNHAQWSKVAVGSIIVIYYANDKNSKIPQDDPTDSDLDNVYIIPHTNTDLLKIYNDYPNSNDFSYGPAVSTSNAWATTMGLNNQNDAVQSRFPNGALFFGISYGNAMTGGPENMKLTNNSLASKNAYFVSGDFRNINNWRVGNAPLNETPGAANNAANQAWIDMLRDPLSSQCALIPLPITMTHFTGEYKNGEVELFWKAQTELNNDYYEIFHSEKGDHFKSIGTVNGAGTINSPKEYNFTHRTFKSGTHYYRLESVDYDGKIHDNGTISVQINRDDIRFDKHTQALHFPSKGEYHIYSSSGQKVLIVNNEAQTNFSRKGFFLVYNAGSGAVTKIVVQ